MNLPHDTPIAELLAAAEVYDLEPNWRDRVWGYDPRSDVVDVPPDWQTTTIFPLAWPIGVLWGAWAWFSWLVDQEGADDGT